MVLTGGAGRQRRYRQGHGCRRYRQGRGPKLLKFKGNMKKAASFGKQHILPHLQEIGTNTLLDIMEGKNVRNSLTLFTPGGVVFMDPPKVFVYNF